MSASQINMPDATGAIVAVDAELVSGKQTPQHGIRDGNNATLGAMADAAATTDAGTSSFIALFKRQLGKLTAGMVAQLGARTVAQSPAVNLATDDPQIGTKVTAVAALPTGGTGLIGWLSNIWSSLSSAVHAEDAASASGDSGIQMLGIRTDAPAVQTSTNGDYGAPSLDKYGAALVRSIEKQAKTYSAGANITVAASATDVFTIAGFAGGQVCVTKIGITGQQTSGVTVDFQIIKRSTVDTSGTSTAPAAVPHDSGDAAAQAVLKAYTANPTLGTAVGPVRRQFVAVNQAASVNAFPGMFEFGDKGKGVFLNGAAEQLAINLNGVTLTGGVLDIFVEWFEI